MTTLAGGFVDEEVVGEGITEENGLEHERQRKWMKSVAYSLGNPIKVTIEVDAKKTHEDLCGAQTPTGYFFVKSRLRPPGSH